MMDHYENQPLSSRSELGVPWVQLVGFRCLEGGVTDNGEPKSAILCSLLSCSGPPLPSFALLPKP
jgi:hypothetical protein